MTDAVLIAVLAAPERLAQLEMAQWELLVRQARAAGLLGRVEALATRVGCPVPEGPDAHLRWAADYAAACAREVLYEVHTLQEVFHRLGLPLVLLKGAAYTAGGLRAGAGRFYEDVDILVPRAELARVESALLQAGWDPTHLDSYDQRYYREWMHELPPMRHRTRASGLDVHHDLLPLTGRLHPDMDAVFSATRSVGEDQSLRLPCPEDLVLHSAAHLFHESEWSRGLRDLSDIHLLIEELVDHQEFWERLSARVDAHGLQRPLYYALRHARRLFNSPVPQEFCDALARRGAPGPMRLRLADAIFGRALLPQHSSCASVLTDAALGALWFRAHWIKMPPGLLARHLVAKSLRRSALVDRQPA